MKILCCLSLFIFVLSLIPSTYQRLRPFHGSRASRFLDRLLSTTRHRHQRPHRKSSIEYGIRRKGWDEKTIRKSLKTHKLSTKGEKTLIPGAEGKGSGHLRRHAHPNTPNVSSYKSAPSHGASSYSRDRKSERVGREYKRRHDEGDLQNSKNPSVKLAHAGNKRGNVKSKKKRKRKMFKKYGFIQAYVPQYQFPLSYQQLQQNEEAPQRAGYLPMVPGGGQTPSADSEQEDNSNTIPQFSDVQQAAFQSTGGQTEQTAAFANSEELQQPQLDSEQLGAQQQAAYAAQLSQQQGEEEEQQQQQQQGVEEQQQEAATNQEGQNQDQQGQDQEGLNQVALNQEGLNQEGLTQSQMGQYQPQEIEGQERQPGAGFVQGELQQNEAQQEAAQPGSEGQGVSESLAGMFSLGNQAGQNPAGEEQRLAGFTGEGVAPQQENNRDAAGPDATEQFQSSLEAALKETGINGDSSNSQGEGQNINIGGDSTHAINIGGDGAALGQDASEAETAPNTAALGNGRVSSPGSYQSAAADDDGRPFRVGGSNGDVNGYSPINGQTFNGEEGTFDDGASQKQQQQPTLQSILGTENGQTRPGGANSPSMDDEMYKIINIANPSTPNHAKGCAGCPPHAKCIDKVCIINDDQPLAHILSALSGSEPSEEADEQNCSSCHYNAKCINNDCVCKPGYTGDGFECRPDTCLPGCKDHGKCINGFCVCDHHHYFNGHSCSPYKISHQSCPSHCSKDCSDADCPPKCCAHNLKTQHLNNGTLGGTVSDGHQVRPKPTNPHKMGDNESPVSQPSNKSCPVNCTSTKCHQSCPGHCCGAADEPPTKLQENIFQGIAEKFCPRACRKQCDPNTCPPICCESGGSPLLPLADLKKNGKATGADVFKSALSWFGMMNLLNMMYDAYTNNSTKAAFISSFKSPLKGEAAGTASNGKDSVKENFLLDPTGNVAKCLPSCSKICSPLCPPNCCTKAATKPTEQASQCPATCKERCGPECSPSCCVLFIAKPPRPVPGLPSGPHSPGAIRPVVSSSVSAVAPARETKTPAQAPAILSPSSAKTALSTAGAHVGCSSICPAYCYPTCTSSCCTGTARSAAQAPAPGTATAQVGRPLTMYPERKPGCPSQCEIWCAPTCSKDCCASPPAQPTTLFATTKDEVGSTCPTGCDARCSPSCPAGCCAAAKLAAQGPITARSCAPQCARWCSPSCDKRCCKGANAPQISNRISCPSECRPYNCLSHCHHECCLRSSAPSKSGLSQAAYAAPRAPGLNLRRQFSNLKDRTFNSYHLNTKTGKPNTVVKYSFGHKSKRKTISRHH